VGVGLVMLGIGGRRAADAAGVMLSFVDLSDAPGAGFGGDETAIEMFYRFQLTPFLCLKPDVQYIVDPSGDRGLADALVGTLRVEVTF